MNAIRAEAVVERIRTNSILNPLLWLCGITEVAAIPAACVTGGAAQAFFCGLSGLPVVAAIVAYFIFAVRDPDRLQTEEYLLERQRMILQGSKEHDLLPNGPQTVDAAAKQIPEAEAVAPDEPPNKFIESQVHTSSNEGD